MAFWNKKTNKTEDDDIKSTAAGYYNLKTKAVDDLASANEGNAPEYSKEELNKYKSRRGKFHIPDAVKIILIKFWFSAVICYFFVWGLGGSLGTMIDTIVIVGIGYGIVTDLLANSLIRFMEKTEGEFSKWMMFPKKKYISFVLNILHGFVVIFLVYTIYNAINYAYIYFTGNSEQVFLGVEPILFGVFCLGADMLLVGMKNLFLKIVNDAKRSA
ncbi:MAG: hypothetical protein K5669_04845 [Lachnospiraceae bacterium]|nr:hypothetical protein [Lachnospiraceae bacterium]